MAICEFDGHVAPRSGCNCDTCARIRAQGYLDRGTPVDGMSIGSTESLLKARGNKYGDVGQQSRLFTDIMDAMGRTDRVRQLSPVQRQSLYMIALKMSRIVCGDPNEVDHWRDIAGYARLPIRHLPDSEGGQ